MVLINNLRNEWLTCTTILNRGLDLIIKLMKNIKLMRIRNVGALQVCYDQTVLNNKLIWIRMCQYITNLKKGEKNECQKNVISTLYQQYSRSIPKHLISTLFHLKP